MPALAAELDRSARELRRLVKKGLIPQQRNKRFDLAAVRKALLENLDHAKSRRPEEPTEAPPVAILEADARDAVNMIARILRSEGRGMAGAPTFNDVRTAETILKARERELSISRMQGELVPKRAVMRHIEEAFANYRKELQAIPARYGAEVAAAVGCKVNDLDRELTRVIHEHLDGLSKPLVKQ